MLPASDAKWTSSGVTSSHSRTNEALRVEPPATSSMSAPEMLTLSDSLLLLLLFVANEARVRRGETGREARRSGVDNPVDPLNVTSVGLKM